MAAHYLVAILGCGFGSFTHIPAFQRQDDCSVAAVYSRRLTKAQQVAKAFNIDVASSNWRNLVTNPKYDLISIALPPHLQADVLPLAVRNHKHIFCEKPLGIPMNQQISFLNEIKQRGLACEVNYEFMENEMFRKFEIMLHQNCIGELRRGTVQWNTQTFAFRKNLESWKTTVNGGGGCLNLFTSHVLHYLGIFFGSPKSIAAQVYSDSPRFSDTRNIIQLGYKSGLTIDIDININTSENHGHSIEINGSHGTIILENCSRDPISGFTLDINTRTQVELVTPPDVEADSNADSRVSATTQKVSKFLKSVSAESKSSSGIEDAIEVDNLINIIRSANESSSTIILEELSF